MAVYPRWLWGRYASARFQYALALARKSYREGKIKRPEEVVRTIYNNVMNEKLTTLHYFKGRHMPFIGVEGNLLVRLIPEPNPKTLRVGDVVLHKDPTNLEADLLLRRIAALEGEEMASDKDDDAPFTLQKDECWVLSDNKTLSIQEAYDSRTFGPVYMPHIVGRTIYVVSHGCGGFPSAKIGRGRIWNSNLSEMEDEAVVQVEVDIDEMLKF